MEFLALYCIYRFVRYMAKYLTVTLNILAVMRREQKVVFVSFCLMTLGQNEIDM